MIENKLEDQLREHFSDDRTLQKRIFDFTGSCGTFASKTDLVYALGFIIPAAYHDIKLVKEIRNTFARKLSVVDFSNPPVYSQINSFKLLGTHLTERTIEPGGFIFSMENVVPRLAIPNLKATLATPRGKYITLIQLLAVGLAHLRLRAKNSVAI